MQASKCIAARRASARRKARIGIGMGIGSSLWAYGEEDVLLVLIDGARVRHRLRLLDHRDALARQDRLVHAQRRRAYLRHAQVRRHLVARYTHTRTDALWLWLTLDIWTHGYRSPSRRRGCALFSLNKRVPFTRKGLC